MAIARGSFEVDLTPLPAAGEGEASGVGRMRLDKRFHGPLEAVGAGEMLASGDGRQFGAYVAIERVEGVLDGHEGGFDLVHHALMREGVPEEWMVTVVPGSGTGALESLCGRMRIEIIDGAHHYALDYSLGGPGDS